MAFSGYPPKVTDSIVVLGVDLADLGVLGNRGQKGGLKKGCKMYPLAMDV